MTINEWETASLGEVAKIRTGKLDSNAAIKGGRYPFFTCSPETLAIDTYAFEGEAVLLAGNNANGVFSVKHYQGKFNAYQRTYVIESIDTSILITRYLYYQFRMLVGGLGAQAIGSATKFLTLKLLKPLSITIPSIQEQRAIAEVLGALDDKIEQNRRTAAKLEELARATFRAWFVDFAPVHAKAAGQTTYPGLPPEAFAALPTTFQPSPLGPIPEGWDTGTLSDFLQQRGERVKAGPETQSLPYVPIDCITPRQITLENYKDGEEAKSSLLHFEAGDVLFGAMRPYFHKVCSAPFAGTTRSTCFVLKPKQSSDRIYSLVLANDADTVEFATTHSVGSTIPYAKWDNSLAKMGCVLPPKSIRRMFGEVMEPVFELAEQSVVESDKLAELRDYLLPRLLSGAVRVRDAEEMVSAGEGLT